MGISAWAGQLPAEPGRIGNLAALFPALTGDEEIRAKLAQIERLLEEAIQEVLEAAANRGHLKPTDTRRLARVLIAAFRGTLLRWAVLPEGPLVNHVHETLGMMLAPYLLNSYSA
jgi:hypothetical protein